MDITDKLGLTALRYFAILAEELHFGRAATRLGIAQPFLSQKIRVLEKAVGTPLFLRTSRHVELTEAGAVFLESVRRSLREVERGADRVDGIGRGELGTLQVGYSMIGMLMVVPDLLKVFRSAYPGVRLALHEISTVPQATQLRDGDLDVGFLSQPVSDRGLRIHREWSEPFCAVVPSDHPLAKARTIRLRDLAAGPFVSVVRWSSPDMYDRMMRDCQDAGVTLSIVQEAGSWQAAVSLVAAGMGVTIAPACVSRLRFPRVRFRELAGTPPMYGLALCTAEAVVSPAVESFLESCGAGSASRHGRGRA
ncbi:MAG: LysR family transcriptional regulator [Gemmatimonadales bacterium]